MLRTFNIDSKYHQYYVLVLFIGIYSLFERNQSMFSSYTEKKIEKISNEIQLDLIWFVELKYVHAYNTMLLCNIYTCVQCDFRPYFGKRVHMVINSIGDFILFFLRFFS